MRTVKKRLRNRNRAWDARTDVCVLATRMAGLIVLAVFLMVTFAVLRNHCKALNREIVRLEFEQRKLVDDLRRERTRWGELKTPANLVRALYRHGLAMNHPTPGQVVYMEPSPHAPRQRTDAPERPVYAAR